MKDHEAIMQNIAAMMRRQDFAGAGQLIEDSLEADPSFAQGRNALLAHWLVLAARWGTVARLLPRDTNWLHSSGWLNSLFASKPVDGAGAPIPWFTYPAIDFLAPRVKPGWQVFEWGSGFSTLWWAAQVRRVRAVEHDARWHAEMSPRLPENARIELIADPVAYVAAIAGAEGPFDVVVVDGEARNDCALAALDHVTPDGLIVFDNSDRQAHREALAALGRAGWQRLDFFGLIPAYLYKNCTSIFFKDPRHLTEGPLPCDVASIVGPTCAGALGE